MTVLKLAKLSPPISAILTSKTQKTQVYNIIAVTAYT